MLPEYDMTGFVRNRSGSSLPGIVPSNTYPCRDGKYVVIGANADSIFKRMMSAIGRQDLADDPGLRHNDGRVAHTERIETAIADWTRAHDLDHVLAVLEKAEVPSGRIYDIADIVADPHYQARAMFEDVRLPDGKPLKLPAIVPKLAATPGETEWVGPALGQHTDEVLEAIGYAAEQRAALRQAGVI